MGTHLRNALKVRTVRHYENLAAGVDQFVFETQDIYTRADLSPKQSYSHYLCGESCKSFWNQYWDEVKYQLMIAIGGLCLANCFNKWCGTSITVAYAVSIFEEDLGFGAVVSRGLVIAMESLLIVGGTATVLTVDRFGRRPLMLLSAIVMTICMAALDGTTSNPSNKGVLYAATVFLFLYAPFFALGFLNNTNLYATAVAPLEYRAVIAGVSTATSWLSNFLVDLVTPVGFSNIGYRYWIIYATNAAIVPTLYFMFPETVGLSLEERDEVFL